MMAAVSQHLLEVLMPEKIAVCALLSARKALGHTPGEAVQEGRLWTAWMRGTQADAPGARSA